ncbi:MAG: GNAT family N-acetyltransferase [bacterium]|nr:GNAT family N-acetyltransferase [bacterium]
MKLIIRKIRTIDHPEVINLIKAFYREDTEGLPTNIRKIRKTFRHLQNSRRGEIIVAKMNNKVVAYSILANYWSNEYGGNILHIDELYVAADYRSHGIGTRMLKYIKKEYGQDAKALMLEVIPSNTRAEHLYNKMGFKPVRNKFFIQKI